MGIFSEYPEHTTPVPTDKVLIYDSLTGTTKVMDYAHFTTRPHINLWNTGTMTVSNTAAEYAVTYNGYSDQVLIDFTNNDSKIYPLRSGMYIVSVSAVIDTTNNVTALFDLWLKVNGVNLSNSNTQVAMNSQNLQQVLAVTFNLSLTAGDYFEFFYHANNTNARILAVAEQTGPPAIPACPSVIVMVSKIGS